MYNNGVIGLESRLSEYFTFLCFYPLCFYYSKALWKYLSTYTFGNRFLSAFCIEIGFYPEDSGNLDYFLEMISFLSHLPDAKNTAEPKESLD